MDDGCDERRAQEEAERRGHGWMDVQRERERVERRVRFVQSCL
jgi:hypothetical protein